MFVDTALAARIEAAEARLSIAVAVPAGGTVTPIGGGIAAFVRTGSPVNKVVGAGFAGDYDDGVLDEIEAAWRGHGELVRWEISSLADPGLARALIARGYQLQGFENVLGRLSGETFPRKPVRGRAPSPTTGVTIEPVTAATTAAFIEVSMTAFGLPAELMADLMAPTDLRRYLARVDGVPAGGAAMRLDDGIAQLCGAGTTPALRRRGVQRALLDARLAEAHAEAHELAIVTTLPGSPSQANVQRLGFALLYTRMVLVRA